MPEDFYPYRLSVMGFCFFASQTALFHSLLRSYLIFFLLSFVAFSALICGKDRVGLFSCHRHESDLRQLYCQAGGLKEPFFILFVRFELNLFESISGYQPFSPRQSISVPILFYEKFMGKFEDDGLRF